MEVVINNFREHRKNTLQGFFDVKLINMGLEIRGCCLHEKDGKQWVQLPSKPYEKEDGSKGWQYIIDIYDKEKRESFQREVLEALNEFREAELF